MSDTTHTPESAGEGTLEDAPMTSELADTIAEMRRTLVTAPLIVMYTAARVAIQVRTDADIVLNHLERTSEGFYEGASDEQIGREGVIVQLKIKTWLASRRDKRRSAEERLADYRHQAEQAQRLLGPSDDQVRTFWESYYLEQARDPTQYAEGKRAFRASLEARGFRFPVDDSKPWKTPMNFRLSLSSQNFAIILRRSSDSADVQLGELITARNSTWRRSQYGARHPFTMVAEGNRLLNALAHAEVLHDTGTTNKAIQTNAQSIVHESAALAANRRHVLGEHHGGTIKAQAYHARALRLLGEPFRARAVAEEALAHYMAYGRPDDTVAAILQLVSAEGYAAEAVAAHQNLEVAFAAGSVLVADDERDRARALWNTVSDRLNSAEQEFLRWPNHGRWLRRVTTLRARRDNAGYGNTTNGG